MTGFLTLLMLVTIVFAIDAIRRPQTQWGAADKNKAFWVTMLIIGSFFTLPFYLAMVMPQFHRSLEYSDEFSKR